MWIPGFGSDEVRPYKKSATTEAHKQVQRLSCNTILYIIHVVFIASGKNWCLQAKMFLRTVTSKYCNLAAWYVSEFVQFLSVHYNMVYSGLYECNEYNAL